MAEADFRGARGSNAGDDFHELWALRQALALLDQDAELTAVTVEGLKTEDEKATDPATWDGVDCALYYGGDQIDSVKRIVIAQLKYSAANPSQKWTVARLTKSSNKKEDNSVIGRLAKAFTGLKKKRPDLVEGEHLLIRLVSNQPLDPMVVNILSGETSSKNSSSERSKNESNRTALLQASGLQDEEFEAFTQALDFSECGHQSRFAIEERVLTTISDWTEDDARLDVEHLMRFVRRAMMPEAREEFITHHSILAQLGFSDPAALFPCPPALKYVGELVPRKVSQSIVQKMSKGEQRICLHGEGGCGKTTVLQEVEALLPKDSILIIFDCYGSGRYLESDAYRHRPADAFLQLSNDLARLLRTPLLLSRSKDLDYPRQFKKRLERAAEVVSSRSADALLVIVVDAADNSVTAADACSPQEKSFVHDFMSLGNLPKNVRLLITARTGRLSSLQLPHGLLQLKMKGFERDETATHVREVWQSAPDTWVDDFDHLSNGNPRVQRYALDYAGTKPVRAIEYLRPNGKGLEQIFQEQLRYALRKEGGEQSIKTFCAGIVALPRPIPIAVLAAVTELDEARLHDLCADLAPGVRLVNFSVGFADEDFEHFVREEAKDHIRPIQIRIADYFLKLHKSDAYAATHVASALLVADRRQDILDLINEEQELQSVSDPVLRREVQLQRLRIAMKVCRETGNHVDAILTLLTGAEALKTDATIQRLFIEHPDLAASFARQSAGRTILRDPQKMEHHGPLLFHLMAADAHEGNAISVREGHRQIRAWLQRREEDFEEQRGRHLGLNPQGWDLHDRDIAAQTEAVLRIEGPQSGITSLLRWTPKPLRLNVAHLLSCKLITSGESALVERCLTEAPIPTPWEILLLTPLAVSGKKVDISRLEASVTNPLHRKLVCLDRLIRAVNDENVTSSYYDLILTACETVVAQGKDFTRVIDVLERFADPEWRRQDKFYTSSTSFIDVSLRAHALLERMARRQTTLESYLLNPPELPQDLSPEETKRRKKSETKKKEELQSFVGPFVDLYDVRAQALLRLVRPEEVDTLLKGAADRLERLGYQLSDQYRATAMRKRAALSIARLMIIPGLDNTILLERASDFFDLRTNPLSSAGVQIFKELALDRSLHQKILSRVTAQAETVKGLKASAEEKLTALIELARLLVPISPADAESVFNDAIEVAGELDADAIHEIALFAPFADRAATCIERDERRTVARDFAIVVADAGIRLAGQDDFPWSKAVQALTILDGSFALAAVARWEDSGIIDRDVLLPHLLKTALSRHHMSPSQIVALSPLLDDFSVELIDQLAKDASAQSGAFELNILLEKLAQEELLRFGRGRRIRVSEVLNFQRTNTEPSFWLDQLMQATAFHQIKRPNQSKADQEKQRLDYTEHEKKRDDLLEAVDWTAYPISKAENIDDVISRIQAVARTADTFLSVSAIFARVKSNVGLGDRVAYLEALSRNKAQEVPDYELAQEIARCIEDWHDVPSVRRWCQQNFTPILVNLLPGFSRWLIYGPSSLPDFLEKCGAPDDQICTALLEGMEQNVDEFSAATVYALVDLVGRYCTPQEAEKVLLRYSTRLVQRIPFHERDKWNLDDVPTESVEGIGRFLYALLGDCDVRVRWRAAHAVRRLARLGETDVIEKLVGSYSRRTEPSYRDPEAPFYWLAARLWLVMALDRIADETPSALEGYGQQLFEIATDDEFPHVLVRSFAKTAVSKLAEAGILELNPTQQDALKRVNASRLSRKKARIYHGIGAHEASYKDMEKRRFRFDSTDTLPYWYSEPLRTFADISMKEFLNSAESWIIDRWGIHDEVWIWNEEPRKDKFSNSRTASLMRHYHGSRPILERFSTYLEWHAMWCATGELMQTHSLAKTGDDDYNSLEGWLRQEGVTSPPLWLSDLLGSKPLQDRLWFAPQGDIDVWVDNIENEDFLAELGLINGDGSINVGGHHDTRSRTFMSSVRVHTALVSPVTAGALVRALQTVDGPWFYRLPAAEDDFEINASPYKLVGWLTEVTRDSGIDERDPLRYEVRTIESHPSRKTEKALNLRAVYDGQTRWIDANDKKTIFVYSAWSDSHGDEREDELRYDETVRSDGWHLRIDKEALTNLLNKMGLDMIVEVEITRRNRSYGNYSRYNEEKEQEKENRFDKLILLRRDGTIEAAEGRLGTWATPRS